MRTVTLARSAAIGLLLVLFVACTPSETVPANTTSLQPSGTTTTATVADPTTSTTTSSAAVTTTTGTRARTSKPGITILGSTLLYSQSGVVTIEGIVDQAAVIAVDGVDVSAYTDPSGRTTFVADFALPPGENVVPVLATNTAGLGGLAMVTVVVDPAFEVQFGYVDAVTTTQSGHMVTVDYAEFLSGEDAKAAAIADGELAPEEDLPNDFYIRNRNPRLRDLPVDNDAAVVLLACWPEECHF